jgi:hypothetical protein
MMKIEREIPIQIDAARIRFSAVCLLRIDEEDGYVVTFVADANAQSSGAA